jgi:MOSC domain-containing protein YiiM
MTWRSTVLDRVRGVLSVGKVITSQPRLLTVNVVHRIRAGYFHDTAIDKRPVDGPVRVTAAGLAGDRQIDSHHGGCDRAVYAYAAEDAHWWAAQLGQAIPPGLFGENLRTCGLDVSGAIIGEQWRIGTVLLEVRMPRNLCQNLSGIPLASTVRAKAHRVVGRSAALAG